MKARTLLLASFLLCSLFGSFLAAEQNILVFLGPPGAGKGTMCKKLSTVTHKPHISTGDLIREQSKAQSALSKELNSYLEQGKLVPDEVIFKMLIERVSQEDCADGFILDGFPRTLDQAKKLVSIFPDKDRLIFVNISVGDDTILERLQGRLICSDCAKSYHTSFTPPAQENQCDDCHGKLVARVDDEYTVIQKRLEVYKKEYAPIQSFLKSNYQWVDVKNHSADECYAQLVNKVNSINTEFLD